MRREENIIVYEPNAGDVSGSQTDTGAGGNFSFLACLSDINKEGTSVWQQPSTKTNLFAALDATDASAQRSKLWGSFSNTGTPSLFSPPRLGQFPPVGSLSSAPFFADVTFSEPAAVEALQNSFKAPEDDQLLKVLSGKLTVIFICMPTTISYAHWQLCPLLAKYNHRIIEFLDKSL